MTNEQFESHVKSSARYDMNLEYCVTAINEEAGEVAGWHKKYNLRKNPVGDLTVDDLKGELGDILFYVTQLASLYNWSLGDVMDYNNAKLKARREQNFRQVV